MAVTHPTERIPEFSDDAVRIAPPTFLERWGIYLVAVIVLWILVVGSWLLYAYLRHAPALPATSGMSPDQVKQAIATHRDLSSEWLEEFTPVFDVLVTKTMIPIVTLLLGYLFGKAKNQ
jgi:hypothetical protein